MRQILAWITGSVRLMPNRVGFFRALTSSLIVSGSILKSEPVIFMSTFRDFSESWTIIEREEGCFQLSNVISAVLKVQGREKVTPSVTDKEPLPMRE